MFWDLVPAVLVQVCVSLGYALPYVVPVALLLSIRPARHACNPAGRWWTSRELATDLCYWLTVPVFTRFLRLALLVAGAAVLFGISGEQQLIAFYDQGHGPWARLPFWAQVALYLLVSDLLLYWIHRALHGRHLWTFHAVHHSSEMLDWTSAARFHPVNLIVGSVLVDLVLLLGGIPPKVLGVLLPFNAAMSAFVHANLNWSLGPLRHVVASPVFHRWHHVAGQHGRNFARTFALIDLAFGTFHLPKAELPAGYGLVGRDVPRSFGEQLLHPLRTPSQPPGSTRGAGSVPQPADPRPLA
jgi:sterol desaturase/sphingolipid hydroxylase (fatty acid hydroxylase superfamily)